MQSCLILKAAFSFASEKETKLSLVLQGAVLCFFHETAFFPRKEEYFET